jgi:hypothetical protein
LAAWAGEAATAHAMAATTANSAYRVLRINGSPPLRELHSPGTETYFKCAEISPVRSGNVARTSELNRRNPVAG